MRSDLQVIRGHIEILVYGPDGRLKHREVTHNLITDAGDGYYAARAIAGISPANPSAPTLLTGMKLGSGSTAASKSGAGAALVTYLAASNKTFDATYPQVSNLGGGLGVNAVYRCSWAAGEATASSIREVVLVNDAASNATSTAANTVARGVFTTVDKTADDVLVIAWSHKHLGA